MKNLLLTFFAFGAITGTASAGTILKCEVTSGDGDIDPVKTVATFNYEDNAVVSLEAYGMKGSLYARTEYYGEEKGNIFISLSAPGAVTNAYNRFLYLDVARGLRVECKR